jgi:exodeoxyribonuclease-3
MGVSKLFSWNVNGIRACQKAGFLTWLDESQADVVCLQETKAFPEQLDELLKNPAGYKTFWNPAQKPGYSGTAIYTKIEPKEVHYGMGVPRFDLEGRVLTAEFSDWVLINAYFPNSQRDHARLPYKVEFCQAIHRYCNTFRAQGKAVVLCGDLNIAHKEIDLKNPKTNVDNAGFLPQERAWLDYFVADGYVDTFRKFNTNPDQYSWWSYRPGVREKNIGWRLDYHLTGVESADRLIGAEIHPQTRGSDHCPVLLKFRT